MRAIHAAETTRSQPLDKVFFALADPTRRAILARLSVGEATVTELAQPFSISMPGISKHLTILADADLIFRRRQGRFRQCRINPSAMKSAVEWLDLYRTFWERQLDSLEQYLQSEVSEEE